MQRLKLFIPLFIFIVLAGFFFAVQKRIGSGDYDPQAMPSALVDKPLPAFALPDLLGGATVTQSVLSGEVALINVWATWCPTCHYEHAYLKTLAEQGVVILGVDYKDDPEKARKFLQERGNPYRAVVDDRAGQFGIDLGATGAPETYVVDSRGVVRMRYQGPLDERVWREKFLPLYELLQREAPDEKKEASGEKNEA